MLYAGGELLVRNAVRLARRFGVSSLVIGFTVVAFGTSSPELAATLVANVQGVPAIAIGNVIGSNIANVGLILGLAAFIYPLSVNRRFVWREVPVMVGITLLLIPVFWGGQIARGEGLVLTAVLAAYLTYLLKTDAGRVVHGDPERRETASREAASVWRASLLALAGVVCLVLGARALVLGAVAIAEYVGVPDRVIGLSLVAVGTSLPELAASLVAALKREGDIILGSIVGSNVFNLLAVLGVTALVMPIPVSLLEVWLDLGVMLALSALMVPLMARRSRLSRSGAVVLLALYAGYLLYLFA